MQISPLFEIQKKIQELQNLLAMASGACSTVEKLVNILHNLEQNVDTLNKNTSKLIDLIEKLQKKEE